MEELINKLNVTIGKTEDGKDFTVDLEKAPHCLITGTTGSGKTVLIKDIIASLIKNNSKKELKLVLVDLKRVEYFRFSNLPHLYCDIVDDLEKLDLALAKLIIEMDDRYKLLMDNKVRTINDYNKVNEVKLPYIFLIIDELYEINSSNFHILTKLSSLGRAVGIHLIVSSQCLQASNMPASLKVNLPTKFVFKVSRMVDSIYALDKGGAEKLKGAGDMIYAFNDVEEKVQVNYLTNQELDEIINEASISKKTLENKKIVNDELFDDIAYYIVENKETKISQVMKTFKIGFTRCTMIFNKLVELGVISESNEEHFVKVSKEELLDILRNK